MKEYNDCYMSLLSCSKLLCGNDSIAVRIGAVAPVIDGLSLTSLPKVLRPEFDKLQSHFHLLREHYRTDGGPDTFPKELYDQFIDLLQDIQMSLNEWWVLEDYFNSPLRNRFEYLHT